MHRKPTISQRRPFHVALITATSEVGCRHMLAGVAQFLRHHGPWITNLEQRSLHDSAPPWLASWKGDGIIVLALQQGVLRQVRKLDLPTVDLSDEERGLGWPAVRNDNVTIGQLAARHLIERGLKNFGFFGLRGHEWSDCRLTGFSQAVAEAGYACQVFEKSQRMARNLWLRSWKDDQHDVTDWLKRLPKPLGLFTCNDLMGLQAINACREAGLDVPHDVSVIGVDNDELACRLASPELSTVVPNWTQIGYKAAEILDGMMRGHPAPSAMCFVPPLGIVTRQSTEVAAIHDPRLAAALEFIKKYACDPIGVEDVVKRAGISRSLLQQMFRNKVGRTIHEMIDEERIARVKQLLEQGDLPLNVIARRTGFVHVEYLGSLFKKRTGLSPGEYRRRFAEPTDQAGSEG